MITLIRIIQAGLRNFLRNSWLSTAATAVMAVTLTVILSAFITTTAMNQAIRSIVNKIDVVVYLKDTITAEQTADFQKRIEHVDNVSKVSYVSKADALKRFRGQLKSGSKLLEALSDQDNALPASFEINVYDKGKMEPLVNFMAQDDIKPYVDTFSYTGDRRATIERIVRASTFLRLIGIIASALFVLISIMIIFNTIRMAIFTRKEEIEIMKLVGATNWFIRGPFVFEGLLYGIIGALVAVALCYVGLIFGGPKLSSYIDVTATIQAFRAVPHLIILGELGIGMSIGTLSSLLALSRYLKL